MNKDDVQKILTDIGLSPSEIAVYLALLDGMQSVKEILRESGEKRPTVYYALGSLEKRGLVSKTGKEYGNKYQLEPIEKLIELVAKNVSRQSALLERTKKLEAVYPTNKRNGKVIVSYFDNQKSIREAISATLYMKEKTVRSIVPALNYFEDMGMDFIKDYVTEKKARGINTKALWEDIPNKSVRNAYYEKSEIRQLPLDMHNNFETTLFLYDDKALYVSPKKENFAVLIQSKEHSKLMKTLFEHIWSTAIAVRG